MPQPYFEMEESRSVTPWVNRLYFESPRVSSFLGLRLVTTRHKTLVPLLSGVKPDPMVGSGRYAEPIPVKSPMALPPLYLLWATCCASTAVLRFNKGTRMVLHRNRTFWVWLTTELPGHFPGGSTVARRLQPCVNGTWLIPPHTLVPHICVIELRQHWFR